MWKIKLGLIVAGIVVAFIGYEEFKVSQGTTKEPMEIQLSSLEQGESVKNNHLKITEHWALFPFSVYEYKQDRGETGDPKPTAKVNHTYYPIISNDHPYLIRLDELAEEYDDLDEVPDEEWPTIGDLAVLVKSEQFATIADIPYDWEFKSELQGLVINRIKSLEKEESRLIQSSFPTVDLDKVLLLEVGRKPSSSLKSLGMVLGGGILSLFGVMLLLRGRKAD